jgi:hypothetical protein
VAEPFDKLRMTVVKGQGFDKALLSFAKGSASGRRGIRKTSS